MFTVLSQKSRENNSNHTVLCFKDGLFNVFYIGRICSYKYKRGKQMNDQRKISKRAKMKEKKL